MDSSPIRGGGMSVDRDSFWVSTVFALNWTSFAEHSSAVMNFFWQVPRVRQVVCCRWNGKVWLGINLAGCGWGLLLRFWLPLRMKCGELFDYVEKSRCKCNYFFLGLWDIAGVKIVIILGHGFEAMQSVPRYVSLLKSHGWSLWCRGRGVTLKSNEPFNCASAESLGLIWDGQRRLSSRMAWLISIFHIWRGKAGSLLNRLEIRWSLKVHMDFSARVL